MTKTNVIEKPIRTIVRGVYDLQKLRISMGNRIVQNFKVKLGQEPGKPEEELGVQEKKLLEQIRESYKRITDGIVSDDGVVYGKLPSFKKFKGDEIISTYTELVLVDEYMSVLKSEEQHFKQLGSVLEEYPIYTEFLKHVTGMGPALSGVIVSEIDIHAAEYPSSLWKYAGLDVHQVGIYTDEAGKEHRLPPHLFEFEYDETGTPYYKGKYPVRFEDMGRTRKPESLVLRQYETKDGTLAERNSITFNPFLKTKLVGVAAGSFLRGGVKVTVNGELMGTAKRLELAKSLGYVPPAKGVQGETTNGFLMNKGFSVVTETSKYAKAYHDYKVRLNNDPKHKGKTDLHKHYMGLRFMMKRFLVDLHRVWRELEGLPVSTEYSEGKLGMIHGKA